MDPYSGETRNRNGSRTRRCSECGFAASLTFPFLANDPPARAAQPGRAAGAGPGAEALLAAGGAVAEEGVAAPLAEAHQGVAPVGLAAVGAG